MNHYTNKKSLALLDHGKWKSALGCTLLLIGFLAFGANIAWAQPDPSNPNIPQGLVMTKKYVPNDIYDGSSGIIRLETYVTGHSIAQHVPTDIVLVLDLSGSMNQNISGTGYAYPPRPSQEYSYTSYGNSTYYYLHTDGQYYPVARERTGNRPDYYYNLHFNIGGTTYYLSGTEVTTTNPNVQGQNNTIWEGVLYERGRTKMHALKASVSQFVDIIAADATAHNVDHRISIVKYAMASWGNGSNESTITEHNEFDGDGYNHTQVVINRNDPKTQAVDIKTAVYNLRAAGATAADYGMNKARYLLASIPDDEFEERSKVVVMFTDGEPNHFSGFDEDVANDVINYGYQMKNSGMVSGTTYDFGATVFTVGVFGTNIDNRTHTYMNYTSSNYPNATDLDNGGEGSPDNGYYFEASSAAGLSEIFVSIAGASGALALPAATIVQDMVSPSFQLPAGASGTVLAYAPKFTGIVDGEYMFENPNDAGELEIDDDGIVTSGTENKLPSDFITVSGKTIQMQGFNFSEHWCGNIEDDNHNEVPNPKGRKIVILIPVEISDGSWGDGIATNDPAGSYIQTPDPNNAGQFIYYGPFNTPMANVLGSVWTEVVTTRPAGFPVITGDGSNQTVEIDSPEDLAWFISEVNGRIGYNVKDGYNSNNVASHPKLNGRLTADIDMSRHNWVPIGCGWQVEIDPDSPQGLTKFKKENGQNVHMTYEGTFDGNGHVITGLKNNASKFYKQVVQNEGGVVVFPGMFSDVKGTIKNVFVLDADFRGKHHNEHFVHHGIIADTLEAGGNIFNCEAAGRITCNNDKPSEDQNLVYGGLVGLNQGTIHSCMAMAELTGYTLGGMIGENGKNGTNGSFSNGFTNGVYNYLGSDNTYKVGGIAGVNPGTIDNCYVRFERNNTNLDKASFNMLVGSGNEASNSYVPQIVTYSRPSSQSITTEVTMNYTVPTVETPDENPDNSYTLSVNKTFYNMFTNDNSVGGTWAPYTYVNNQGQTVTNNNIMVFSGGTSLLELLEGGKGTGVSWKRTTAGGYSVGAGDINDDYPVLQFDDYTCLASTDGISIDYAHNISDMLHRHNSGALNENTALADSYKVTDHAAINGGSINLFANEDMNPSNSNSGAKADLDASYYNTDANVVVYIDENISLLQPTDATTTPSSIEAYTGQTLQAFNNTATQEGDRWHNISSSLSNSQFGWHYNNNEQVTHNFESDPCGWNLNNFDEDYAFFPIDLSSYHRAEFYCFFEPEYHWINFRRNGQSHWHMDNYTTKIQYEYTLNGVTHELENEEQFIPGKGYLAAVDMSTYWSGYNRTEQFLQNRGTLNNGAVDIPVTYTTDAIIDLDGYHTGLEGYNLLGNPYQSFLDFGLFATGQEEGFWGGSKFAQTCAVYDPSEGAYLQIPPTTPSEGAKVAGPTINMHQGFFIQVGETGTAHFTNDMRTNDAEPNFRGSRPTYPLINFTVTDREGNNDVAVLELNRPENDGAKKLRTGNSVGRIYFRYDNTNMAIFFRDNAEGHQTLNFAAEEDGNFTLNWNTANADFRSLTLVDNITGIKTDMLTHDHYTFEGRVDDYNTRFKIVFGEMDNNEEEPVLEHFAFFDHGNLIVNGTGHFEVVDVLGRVVYATELTDTQNTVSLPSNVRGVCMLCFTRNNETKVQKMVIQ